MNVSARSHSAGFPIYTVRSEENAFELSAFGGQLLSWTKSGVPILFANRDHAVLDGRTAYRGGSPICFPYFGRGPLLPSATPLNPQHGRARTTVWTSEIREDESAVVLRTEQPSPEGYGPTKFLCEIAYVFAEGIRIEIRVANVGESEAPFQLAVHSYWACEEPPKAIVRGLGERYLDNLGGLAESQDPTPDASHTPPFDRIYPDAADHLELIAERYRVSISTQGGAGTVLWNPGPNHGIADLGSPNFICVESGVVTPSKVLRPGEEHRIQLGYRAQLLR